MLTLLTHLGISLLLVLGVLFAPFTVALAQQAEDTNALRAEIGVDEDVAAADLQQDSDSFVAKAERSLGDELKRDVDQFKALRGEGAPQNSPIAAPALDDSNASIERDIESLESQAHALGSTK